MADDSTEPKSTLDALRRSEARFAGILAIAADAIILINDQQQITLFNEGAERAFGYKSEEVLGKSLNSLIPARFHNAHAGHVTQFGSSRSTARKMGERQEIFALHKDGTEFPAEASISKLEIDGERTYTVVLRDISERKAAEAALRESEQRLWAFLDNSSVIGWMKDENGRYVFLSGNFQRRFGVRTEDWMGRTDFDLWPRQVAEKIRKHDLAVLAEDRELEILEETANADGSTTKWLSHKFPFRDASGRSFIGGLGVDISARIAAEEALAKSHALLETRVEERTSELRNEMKLHHEAQAAVARLQRLEALGQLTGGVAHDFNNLLTVISGNLQLIGMELEEPRLRKYLDEADRAAEMGARLNQRLMTFAKQRRLSPMATNLNDQVIGVRDLLQRSLGERIALVTDLSEIWTVLVDPSEIENALVNLAINARDAMPDGGTLTITTRNIEFGEPDARKDAGLSPGAYVMLSVSDTGTGMSEEVQARAFEPFFTTKDHGRGTGLGLSTIFGFVRQSGGHIAIESKIGLGTTVRLYLPRLNEQDAAIKSPTRHSAGTAPTGQMILVVEDNADVRRVTVERLTALGYRTHGAEDGRAAIDTLEGGHQVDLVFSDVVMPGGLSGFDLAQHIHERWPHLPVLLTSGYAPETEDGPAYEAGRQEILMKPYTQAALAEAIAKSLHGARVRIAQRRR